MQPISSAMFSYLTTKPSLRVAQTYNLGLVNGPGCGQEELLVELEDDVLEELLDEYEEEELLEYDE